VNGLQAPELWCVDLSAAAPALNAIERRIPRLNAEDRARAALFSDARARADWLATHVALRVLIERAVGPAWRGAALTRAARGKPQLAGAPLGFSLSHARGVALIGLTPTGSIGVDVERTREVRIAAERRAAIEAAGAMLGGALAGDGSARFLHAWVRLEAHAKADGCGIGRLLTRLGILGVAAADRADASGMPARVDGVLGGAAEGVRDLQLGDGLYAAAAFIGVQPVAGVAWLPTDAESLEKLIN
jgi:4'-phosphopantetheinyl transferase